MIDRCGKLDVTEVTRTLGHVLGTGLALELAVDGAQAGVIQTVLAGLGLLGVHCLGILDVGDTQALDLIGRHDSKLDLLNGLDRRTGVRKREVRHLGGRIGGVS